MSTSRRNFQKSSLKTRTNTNSWKRTFVDDNNSQSDGELDENSQCIICAEKIQYSAKSPCNHTTCHKCTFRQRALYNKKACLVCRTENDKLIFTEQLDKDYVEITQFVIYDEKFGIEFTSQYAHDDTLSLLQFKCQLCGEVKPDSKKLNAHLKSEHEKMICVICSDNKKSFPSELKVYTQRELQTHQQRGDEKGFAGHPLCPFCKGLRFYSDDELKLHYRSNHEKCHVCDRIDPSNPQYFKDYNSLEDHFRVGHFMCNFQVCLDKKFVVFEDELDLQAHMLQEHGGVYDKNYVVGASNNNRFRSQLSTFSPISSKSSEPQADSLETKKMRFEERARHYLNYSTSAFKEFTDLNNRYKNGKISTLALKDSYNGLFSENTEQEIHLLLYDLAELYPKNTTQGLELSTIVNEQERKNKEETDFPALAGSSSSLNMYGGSSWGSSSKSKKSKGGAIEEDFPALPVGRSSKSSYTPVKTTVRYKTVIHQANAKPSKVQVNNTRSTYVPNYLSASSTSSSSKPKPSPSAPLNENLFPSLPKPVPKKVIPRVNPVPQGNGAWDLGSANSSSSTLNLSGLDESLPVVAKGKGKKKKQILFQLGGK